LTESTLDFQDLERVYELLAKSIDEVGQEKETLFLSKLCLLLAHKVADISLVEEAVKVARRMEPDI
jgi:hypothetical protein